MLLTNDTAFVAMIGMTSLVYLFCGALDSLGRGFGWVECRHGRGQTARPSRILFVRWLWHFDALKARCLYQCWTGCAVEQDWRLVKPWMTKASAEIEVSRGCVYPSRVFLGPFCDEVEDSLTNAACQHV